ncbi:response regulator [Marinibactrum halimedae]|uniref:histidine kinase n=1 Tax=Marinibactrum halimedae TaxID=1444977 RepID=A0AA37TAB6_9GAMM|nr:response regulator [Marinibactrum halimedae]MCD9459551.1 response regulator [Marinibactrum halimedae]GLS25632.1 hypothetical protein GCM10007877_13460 [Marinibactrum halimedae]
MTTSLDMNEAINTSHPHPAILLVDDNPVNLQLISKILENEKMEINQAINGAQCLSMMSTQEFDLVLLDLNMPEIDGLEVLRRVKEWTQVTLPTFVVVSADNSPESISQAFKLGAADYITTPFKKEEMLARINTQLHLRSRERHLESLVQRRTVELVEANKRVQDTYHQLVQAEKMASLGQLAAGVAHEINNPVGYISSNLDTLNAYLDDILDMVQFYEGAMVHIKHEPTKTLIKNKRAQLDIEFIEEDIKHIISESQTGVERVIQIVSDLKNFSHPEQKAWQTADINQCIDSALNIVHNQLKYKANIHKHYENHLPQVECIIPQISQVLVNLFVNAGQAMKQFGDIHITSRCVNENNIEIVIEDNGCGIESALLTNIFNPFFTTKPVGEGTGLGLSVSYGIIQNHGGDIDVHSKVGEGSRFTIRLPIKQGMPPSH